MENMEIQKDVQVNTEPQTNAPAEESGEKLFTQDDVNRIVQERLSRVKADSSPQFADKERELQQRESRLNCREFLAETGKPAALLDILDTTDFDKFKKSVELMAEKMPQAFQPVREPKPTGKKINIGIPLTQTHTVSDPVAECFRSAGSAPYSPLTTAEMRAYKAFNPAMQ